jgi:vacuolar-type H+-ATPase catalytic subunit A/Vma1
MAPAKVIRQGKIYGVSGPVVTGEGLLGVKMLEVVRIGDLKLTGEVIRIDGEQAIIQSYEDTCKSHR